MKIPVFDLHCDTAYAMLGHDGSHRWDLWDNPLHVDMMQAMEFSRYVQCFACFTSRIDEICQRLTPERVFQAEYTAILHQLSEHHDKIRQAYSSADILENCENGYISAILTIEGPAGFGYDPGYLPELRRKGFLITTLGWNDANCLTGSHASGGGLTERGREFVLTAQDCGMIVDVSHISDDAFWQIMDLSGTAVIASHSNSRRIRPVSRNLTDEMFLALCETGGLAGINLYTEFLGTNPTIDTVCDHIFHFLELDPTGKHIALGGDLDGCSSLPAGFKGIQSYSSLAEQLLKRGLSKIMLEDIFWNNAIGVIERCCT